MHLCMQDDLIGQKIVGLAPADMSPSIITKNILVVNNLVCQLGLHLIWTCLALQGKSSVFLSVHSPSGSQISMVLRCPFSSAPVSRSLQTIKRTSQSLSFVSASSDPFFKRLLWAGGGWGWGFCEFLEWFALFLLFVCGALAFWTSRVSFEHWCTYHRGKQRYVCTYVGAM
jgi:hypothetical protein